MHDKESTYVGNGERETENLRDENFTRHETIYTPWGRKKLATRKHSRAREKYPVKMRDWKIRCETFPTTGCFPNGEGMRDKDG